MGPVVCGALNLGLGREEQAEEGNGPAADKVKRTGGGVGGVGDGGGEVR